MAGKRGYLRCKNLRKSTEKVLVGRVRISESLLWSSLPGIYQYPSSIYAIGDSEKTLKKRHCLDNLAL